MAQTEQLRKMIDLIDGYTNTMSQAPSTTTMKTMASLCKQGLMLQSMESSILISSKNKEIASLQERLDATIKQMELLEENARLKEDIYKNNLARLEGQLKGNVELFHRNVEELHCKTNEIYESIQKLKTNG